MSLSDGADDPALPSKRVVQLAAESPEFLWIMRLDHEAHRAARPSMGMWQVRSSGFGKEDAETCVMALRQGHVR